MISAGGTSAVITLGAMGILANCARHEPDTIAAMANFGKPAFDRALFLPEPTLNGLDRYPAGRRRGDRRTPQTSLDTRTTRDNPNPTVQHPSGPKTGESRGQGAARSRAASAPTPKKTGFFPGRSRTPQPVRRPLPARTTARDTSRDPNRPPHQPNNKPRTSPNPHILRTPRPPLRPLPHHRPSLSHHTNQPPPFTPHPPPPPTHKNPIPSPRHGTFVTESHSKKT